MESSGKLSSSSVFTDEDERNNVLNFKATELRLGLPGSQSPDRSSDGMEDKNVQSLGVLKNLVSGAKRGFSDAIDETSAKWVFSKPGGSEVDLGKNGGLFSPRGSNGGVKPLGVSGQKPGLGTPAGSGAAPQSPKPMLEKKPEISPSANRAQVVGWPPIRSFRKNTMATNNPQKNDESGEGKSGVGCLYVKVSMDGAPYLRKVDLKTYSSYLELSSALEKMFSCFTIGQCGAHGVPGRDGLSESRLMDLLHGSEYVLTYEDKDGDWMLVGDVPWEMFTESCKRMRIMKSSEAIGLAPRAMEKCKNRN